MNTAAAGETELWGSSSAAADAREVERYLHTHIPLSRGMGVRVAALDEAGVRLAAPLGPNINHRSTVFGGSASALAILSAWTLLHVRLRAHSFAGHVVIQRNSVEYLSPIHGDFEAFCPTPPERVWGRFVDTLASRGKARLVLTAELLAAGVVTGTFRGEYVALGGEEG
ncbi:MAG: thioesterase domain-containing protein [Gemmatimonadota bacterium]|nr:thioesterase domain-containing protein [Gemmatimonadota bacterium]